MFLLFVLVFCKFTLKTKITQQSRRQRQLQHRRHISCGNILILLTLIGCEMHTRTHTHMLAVVQSFFLSCFSNIAASIGGH